MTAWMAEAVTITNGEALFLCLLPVLLGLIGWLMGRLGL